jgi:hypothetical protein
MNRVAEFGNYWRSATFVWLVWAASTFIPIYTTSIYGTRLPFSDDWNLVPIITRHDPMSLAWLWAQHNEHRIVIPKLVFIILYRATNADFRSVVYVNIFLLSFLSAASILVLRSVRGRTLYFDAFYPLFLMHLGQFAFFWGFELQFTLVTTLVCLISIVFIYSGPTLNSSASILAGSFLILLPVSGGNGLLYVPGIAVWMVIRATCRVGGLAGQGNPVMRFVRVGSPSPAARRAQIIMLGSAAASIAISIAYFAGYKRISRPAPDILHLMSQTLHVLGAGFGQLPDGFWPLFGVASAILVAASFAYAVLVGSNRQQSPMLRCRTIDIAAFMIAFMPVALGVAFGRGGQASFAISHYATLALPILYWSFMSWNLGMSRLPAKFIQAVLCAIMCIFWIKYVNIGVHNAKDRILKMAEIEREFKGGVATDIMVDRHILDLFYADTPWARRLVQDGIDDFRKAGFAQFGAAGRTD